jgi:hypothetical protein
MSFDTLASSSLLFCLAVLETTWCHCSLAFQVVRSLDPAAPVRLLLQEIRGQQKMVTLRPDVHYWPTQDARRNADGTWTTPEDSSS